jgi:phage protein D
MADDQSAFSTTVEVSFNGTKLEDKDVISFVIERDFNQIDMAVVTLRNDAHKMTKDRNHAQSCEIKAGGAKEGSPKMTLFKGVVWGIEPQYKAQGDSKVVIRCYHKARKLLQGKKSKTWQSKSDNDVITDIINADGLTPHVGSDPSVQHDHVYQHNQVNMEFIRVRAARLGFYIWCDGEKDVYVDKPNLSDAPVGELKIEEAAEHHLKTASLRMSSANVLNKVTVQGWDPKKKEKISGDAEAQSSPLGGKNAKTGAGDQGNTETFTVDHPIFAPDEAKAIAKSKLQDANLSYITGELECRGHGNYMPGKIVDVTVNGDEASDRFNGKYLIIGVTHRYTHGSGGGDRSGGFVSVLRVARDAEK